jgi:hypothetical protein
MAEFLIFSGFCVVFGFPGMLLGLGIAKRLSMSPEAGIRIAFLSGGIATFGAGWIMRLSIGWP